jgi:outer membrane protein assembly factor BamB
MKISNSLLYTITFLVGASGAAAQDWPQWRGPGRDNHVVGFKAPAVWPKEPAKKWKVTVGVGESSPTLVGNRLYVFGRQEGDEVMHCLDADTGKPVWTDKYATDAATGGAKGYPGPRATPAVGEGKVIALGLRGAVSCYDAEGGKLLWRKNADNKAKESYPQFFTSSSPLIADGVGIVFVKALMAYNLSDGSVKWKWTGGATPYGSPVLAEIAGVKQVVTPFDGGLAGVGFADGKLLWKVSVGATGVWQSHYSTPIVVGNNVYYSSASGKMGGGASFTALKIEKKGDGLAATEVWQKKTAAHGYHTPLYKDGLLYGVSLGKRNFFCLDAKTGAELWKDDEQRGECGAILDVGPVLIALTADRDLIAFKASNKKYEEVGKIRVSDSPTWCVPILSGNRIYVKDKGGALALLTLP